MKIQNIIQTLKFGLFFDELSGYIHKPYIDAVYSAGHNVGLNTFVARICDVQYFCLYRNFVVFLNPKCV